MAGAVLHFFAIQAVVKFRPTGRVFRPYLGHLPNPVQRKNTGQYADNLKNYKFFSGLCKINIINWIRNLLSKNTKSNDGAKYFSHEHCRLVVVCFAVVLNRVMINTYSKGRNLTGKVRWLVSAGPKPRVTMTVWLNSACYGRDGFPI